MKLLPFALLLLLLRSCKNRDKYSTANATAALQASDNIREDFIKQQKWNREWRKVLKELDEPVDLSEAKYEVFRYTLIPSFRPIFIFRVE